MLRRTHLSGVKFNGEVMPTHEIELNCECPHCGKALYHTVPWLRRNATITCADCGSTMASTEILGVNTRKVREFDDAERSNKGLE